MIMSSSVVYAIAQGMSLQPVFANVKYIICAGLAVTILQTPVGQALLASRTFEEMAYVVRPASIPLLFLVV